MKDKATNSIKAQNIQTHNIDTSPSTGWCTLQVHDTYILT